MGCFASKEEYAVPARSINGVEPRVAKYSKPKWKSPSPITETKLKVTPYLLLKAFSRVIFIASSYLSTVFVRLVGLDSWQEFSSHKQNQRGVNS